MKGATRLPAVTAKNKPRLCAGACRLAVCGQDAQSCGTAARKDAGWSTVLFERCDALNGWANTRHPPCPPRLTERRVDGCRPVLRYANRVVADVSTTMAGRGGSSLQPRPGRVVLVSAVHYPAARKPLCSGFHIWISSLSFRSLFSATCAEICNTIRTAGSASRPPRRC